MLKWAQPPLTYALPRVLYPMSMTSANSHCITAQYETGLELVCDLLASTSIYMIMMY